MSNIFPSPGGGGGDSIDPGSPGDIPISDGVGYDPTSPGNILGTPNQITVTNGTDVTVGADVVLSLPSSTSIDNLLTGSVSFTQGAALSNDSPNNATLAGFIKTSEIPTDPQHLVNKAYVDAVAEGLSVKNSVKVATQHTISLSGLQQIDGYTQSVNDRTLVKNQTNPVENGIYVASVGAWSRSSDANTGTELSGSFTFVEHGTGNAGSGWVTPTDPITIGVTPVVYTQFSAAGYYTAGTGLNLSGSQFSLTTPVSVPNGGTGATTASGARTNLGAAASGNNTDITSLTGLTTPLSGAQGGTGSTYGVGLVGGFSSASDTSGTVTLTASSAGTRLFNQGSNNLIYELPLASTCPGKIFFFRRQGASTNSGDLTFNPSGTDTVGTITPAGTGLSIFTAITSNFNAALISDGVSSWQWLIQPNQLLDPLGGLPIAYSGGLLRTMVLIQSQGGTGSSHGAGLFANGTAVTDTTGTVALSIFTSDSLRLGNTAGGNITYNLPPANTCPGKIYSFYKLSSSNAILAQPFTGDKVEGNVTNGLQTISAAGGLDGVISLISNGVNTWAFLQKPIDGAPNNWTQGGVLYGSDRLRLSAAGTTGQPLLSGGTGAPTFGTLGVGGGGTGATTLTSGGVLTGTGTSAITAGGTVTSGIWNAGNVTSSGTVTATSGDITATNGHFVSSTVGKTLSLKTGANGSRGTGTLVAGTVTISNTSITANSIVLVQPASSGVNSGVLAVTAKTVGTDFTVTSSNALDTATFDYVIIEGN